MFCSKHDQDNRLRCHRLNNLRAVTVKVAGSKQGWWRHSQICINVFYKLQGCDLVISYEASGSHACAGCLSKTKKRKVSVKNEAVHGCHGEVLCALCPLIVCCVDSSGCANDEDSQQPGCALMAATRCLQAFYEMNGLVANDVDSLIYCVVSKRLFTDHAVSAFAECRAASQTGRPALWSYAVLLSIKCSDCTFVHVYIKHYLGCSGKSFPAVRVKKEAWSLQRSYCNAFIDLEWSW